MYRFAQYTFYPDTALLVANEQQTKLRNKVALLLQYFLEHQNVLLSKEQILDALWQQSEFRETALTQSIGELRRALNDDAKAPQFIKTVPQRGYMWIGAEQAQQSTQPVKAHTANRRMMLFAVLSLLAMTLWAALEFTAWQTQEHPHSVSTQTGQLLVLPFENQTGDEAMNWLQLGLADMLSVDLKRSGLVEVISPAQASLILLENNLRSETSIADIQLLLNDDAISAALQTHVRTYKQQQVLDFKLLYRDGRVQQGSLSFDNLAANIEQVATHILRLLNPLGETVLQSQQPDLSAMAIAQGMQALQTSGAHQAAKFFQASLTLQHSPWAQAYLAKSQIALGQWPEAEQALIALRQSQLADDPLLDAFVAMLWADLAIKKGDSQAQQWVALSLKKSKLSKDKLLIAKSLKLKSTLLWRANLWQQHKETQQQISQYLSGFQTQEVTADRQFYLGEAANIGLEQDPYSDLVANADKLQQALGFYTTLGDLDKQTATQLALAQNYSQPLAQRKEYLANALSGYARLKQPYDLAVTEVYAGFFYMQLHRGDIALKHFQSALTKAQKLQATGLINWAEFYIGFAFLDLGLDQRQKNRHGLNREMLAKAITQLQRVETEQQSSLIKASSQIFLAWAHVELDQPQVAINYLNSALVLTRPEHYAMTAAYARYSLMYIYLQLGDLSKVLSLAVDAPITRLELVYTARAYAELGQFGSAADELKRLKAELPTLWQQQDAVTLQQYQQSASGKNWLQTELEKAHLVYCESDWQLSDLR